MTVQIKIAQTTEELDAVFRLRHRVMAEEERYITPQSDERIADRFDAFPTSANVIAVVEGRIVGSVRLVERTAAGTSADEYFDFQPHLPPGARDAAVSQIVVEREYRATPRLVVAMMGKGYYWAMYRELTHVVSATNPERREGFERTGFRAVAPEFWHDDKELRVLPMVLDLNDLSDRFLRFIQRHEMEHWLHAFEAQFHVAGDVVIRRGEAGRAAYVVVDGEAKVTISDDDATTVTLGPGDVFGELALLTSRPRSADVVAVTDVDLMVLEREVFLRQLRERPETAERMLELVANRMAALLDQRGEGSWARA